MLETRLRAFVPDTTGGTAGFVGTNRLLTASTGLGGGGDLSADRSFSINTNVRDKTFGFFGAGNISTAMFLEEARTYIPFNMSVQSVFITATTAPTGANIIVQMNQYNAALSASTAMFAAGNRPQIPSSALVGSSLTFDIPNLYAGSFLGVQIDQCGSTNAGSNLTVTLISRSS